MNRPSLLALAACVLAMSAAAVGQARKESSPVTTLNAKDDGYRGIWYMNQPSNDEYVYKYSGGLGTYCAKHQPFAVHCPAAGKAGKTFFCYGGAAKGDDRRLLHMVSWYDHATGQVPRPTVLLDKQTDDAHDNPVISVDSRGHIWIFSTSHGTGRPSFIHKSARPYDVESFDRVPAVRRQGETDAPITNFSYMQAWHAGEAGFAGFFTRYNDPAARTIQFMYSPDGVSWSRWTRLAAIQAGHYAVSAVSGTTAGTVFNYHPAGKGLNWRTNLYYLQTTDFGLSWRTIDGQSPELPLRQPDNPALVHDFAREKLNVYLKDIAFGADGRPVFLVVTSKGYESGPKNDPRTWTTVRWTGEKWLVRPAMTSDNNYDTGSLYLEADGTWRIIGPTETGPQPYNPGGEMAMWTSSDQGLTWKKVKQLTVSSERNHTYARRPVNAHEGFYALWADGHGRQPSLSRLYFCDKAGNVRVLPREMTGQVAVPQLLGGGS